MSEESQRQLCPDDACIGVIGEDGRCGECGAVGEPSRVGAMPAGAADEHTEPADLDSGEDEQGETSAGDDDRQLCSDGSCIGLIGADGRCKECGAPGASGSRPSDEGDVLQPDRELCPDGACVGLIGPDGRCRECGTPGRSATLDPRQRHLLSEEEMREMGRDGSAGDGDHGGSRFDDDDRELCPDGACIGLIGEGGRCKECGTPARPA